MKKNFVLDTNIFIYEPECLFKFEDNDLYITPVTLREISGLKNADGETGYSARRVKQILDDLRNHKNNLKDGISLGEDLGTLFITTGVDFQDFKPGMSMDKNDDIILAASAWLSKHSDYETILVTDDVDMSFLADIIGVKTERFKNQRVGDKSYHGRTDLLVPSSVIQDYYKGIPYSPAEKIIRNQFVVLHNELNYSNSAIGKYDGKNIVPLKTKDSKPFDITPRNNGQRFLIEALLAPPEEIPLVIAIGPAGTAKTFISLACGLESVVERKDYRKILITRANVQMDATYGHLPGSEEEKVSPMMRPFLDNLEEIMTSENNEMKDGVPVPSSIESLFENGYIKAESMEYMRGRSLSHTYVIIDEAQNCTPNQILSIVTRIGVGSKIVLLGDPNQIDNKFLNKRNNGLVFAAERFIGSSLCAQITMKSTECERSPLAMEAIERLKRK